jgi:hypothetical protein
MPSSWMSIPTETNATPKCLSNLHTKSFKLLYPSHLKSMFNLPFRVFKNFHTMWKGNGSSWDEDDEFSKSIMIKFNHEKQIDQEVSLSKPEVSTTIFRNLWTIIWIKNISAKGVWR